MEQLESIELDEASIKALNHDIRRKILLELFEQGWAGYTELTRVLKLTTGVFYHHIRLLEEAELVEQSKAKIYEITPKGIQAIDFLKHSFPPIKESQVEHWLRYYTTFSNIIDSSPLLSIFIQLFIIVSGLLWLGLNYQYSLIGYFIISFNQPTTTVIYSLIFTFTNLILLYAYLVVTSRRFIKEIPLAANVLFPQTIAVLIAVMVSVLPILTIFEMLSPFFGISVTLFFQSFSLTYYLHILQKSGKRSMEKIILVVILLQYLNLLILYVFF